MDQDTVEAVHVSLATQSRFFLRMLWELLKEVGKAFLVVMTALVVFCWMSGETLPWWIVVFAGYQAMTTVRMNLLASKTDAMMEHQRAIKGRQDAIAKSLRQAHQAHTLNGEMIQSIVKVRDTSAEDAPPKLH